MQKKILFSLILLFLNVTSFRQKPTFDLNIYLLQEIQKTEKSLFYLRKNLTIKSLASLNNDYEILRNQFHAFSWVFPKYFSIDEIQTLNNSKYWVLNDPIFERNYPETGAFQSLEKSLFTKKSTKKATQAIVVILKKLDQLKTQIQENPIQDKEVLMLMYVSIQDNYILQLTGYERVNTKNIVPETRQTLQVLENIYNHLPYSDTKIARSFANSIEYLSKKDFDHLNRFEFYQKHIQYLLSSLQQSDLQINSNRRPFYLKDKFAQNWAINDIFSEDFLSVEYFTNLPEKPDSSIVKLGEYLFFDPLLSGNNKRSCSSCHKPQKAFTDGRQTSLGFNFSEKLVRNAPTLLNSVYNQYYGHDLGKNNLEQQILSVVNSHQEFKSSMKEIVSKLSQSSDYQELYQQSFPQSAIIDSVNTLKALVVYMGKLKSFDSEFDKSIHDTKTENTSIKEGYNLFMGKSGCGSCHFAPLFSGLKPPFFQKSEYQSVFVPQNLVDKTQRDNDLGLGGVARKSKDGEYNYFFKTPSLRNLQFSTPLFHNGIMIDLEEAVRFHVKSKNIFKNIESYSDGGREISDDELKKIVTFLNSLNTNFPQKKYPEPANLPNLNSKNNSLNQRKVGGTY